MAAASDHRTSSSSHPYALSTRFQPMPSSSSSHQHSQKHQALHKREGGSPHSSKAKLPGGGSIRRSKTPQHGVDRATELPSAKNSFTDSTGSEALTSRHRRLPLPSSIVDDVPRLTQPSSGAEHPNIYEGSCRYLPPSAVNNGNHGRTTQHIHNRPASRKGGNWLAPAPAPGFPH